MIFDNKINLDNETFNNVTKIVEALFCELALSDNGIAGKAGNTALFLTMMDYQHELSNDVDSIQVSDSTIIWNPLYVTTATRVDIRSKLEASFTLTKENTEKLTAKFHEERPAYVDKVVSTGEFVTSNDVELLVLSNNVCKHWGVELNKLSSDMVRVVADDDNVTTLLKNDHSKNIIKWITNSLPSYIFLYAVRTNLGLELVITCGLDEIEFFGKKLDIINDMLFN